MTLSTKLKVYGIYHSGLGNQLFIALATVKYALDHAGQAYYYDQEPFIHPYAYVHNSELYFDKLIHIPKGQSENYRLIREPKEFSPEVLPGPEKGDSAIALTGCFQQLYYLPPKAIIDQYIYWLPADIQVVETNYQQILALNHTVSVHIRRGDYLQCCSYEVARLANYTIKAMNIMMQKLRQRDINPNWVFFSDDIAWVKSVYGQIPNASFVESGKDYHDLYLMTRCENHIIANSTFSWWGAYLSKHDGITIAPYPWMKDLSGMNGIYPESWFLVECP